MGKYDFTQMLTSKFIHALVCDVTNLARYVLFAYIIYLVQPHIAIILFAVMGIHYVSKWLFTKALQQEAHR